MPERLSVTITAEGPATKTQQQLVRGVKKLLDDLAAKHVTAEAAFEPAERITERRKR